MISFFSSKKRRRARARNIRIVATDLDGTLLDDTNSIPAENLEAIAALRQTGVDVLLATGRTDGFTRTFARQISSTLPIISLSGALVLGHDGNVMHASWLNEEAAELVLDTVRNHVGSTLTLFTPEGLMSQTFPLQLPRYLRAHPQEHHSVELMHEHIDRTVMMVVTGPYAVVQEISTTLAKRYKGMFERTSYQSRQAADHFYLEIRNSGVNKGTALRAILPKMGVQPREVAAIGDFANDIDMCRMAGLSASMQNGIEELLGIVDFVTQKSNNEAGAAEFFTFIHQARLHSA